jgi:hypothetical protein
MMNHKVPHPFGAILGTKMKALATLTIGATAFLGAYAADAAEEALEFNFKETDRHEAVGTPAVEDGDAHGFRLIVDEAAPKEGADPAPLATPEPPAPGARRPEAPRTVRMVVETTSDEGSEESTLCVFVPAGDEAGGALSCPGGNVRVFEFGGDHGRQFVVGDEVIEEQEIRALVEARIAEVNERLADRERWDIEVVRGFDNEEFHRQMEALGREMEQLQQTMRFEFQTDAGMNAEERAEYQAAMAEFRAEMADLQAEAMAEAASVMAHLREEGLPIVPQAPGASFNWFDGGPHSDTGRQVIRINNNGDEHVTIIERGVDEDGNPKLTIRTTDPESVEVVGIDADELDD